MDCDSAPGATAVEESPDWWPYAPEFPHWHVWRGVAGLLYARRPKSSPPKVVRGRDLTTLREVAASDVYTLFTLFSDPAVTAYMAPPPP